MKHILVCGGAGYIGAHMARALAAAGHKVSVFDNLSTGHRQAVQWGDLIEGDLLDPVALDSLFASHRFDAVMHFCARSLVAESVAEPYLYYRNNVAGTLNLLEAMRKAKVDKLVFSSTAAVYGVPKAETLDETHPTQPINPYGVGKRMVEQILEDGARACGLRSVALRYFNAAGASPDGMIGESHCPETHLIPNILKSALGGGEALRVFGTDYETRDGTCVRDYVHVDDLAAAHLKALDYLEENAGAHCFNLGSGQGFTVREVVAAARQVTACSIPVIEAPRREGDPPILIADSNRARRLLEWVPRYDSITAIIETAWRWHCNPRY